MSEMKIGDKVVCINDIGWKNSGDIKLIYNKEYTIIDKIYCKNCRKYHYDIGLRTSNIDYLSGCGDDGFKIPGKGIDWINEYRIKPYIVNFKNYIRKEIIEHLHDDIKKCVESKEYEKAMEYINRLEKIESED